MPVVLCDLDDTLVERTKIFRAWAMSYGQRRGLDSQFVDWLIEQDAGGYRPRVELFDLVRTRLGLAESSEELASIFRAEFNSLFRCEADVTAALQALRLNGWKIAIVTNGAPTQLDKITSAALLPLVDAWAISEVDGYRKPDPMLLRVAAARAGGDLTGAWMIGDHPANDIGAAHAAGIRSIWLSRGRSWPVDDYQPTYQVETFEQGAALVTSYAD